jgi:alkylhydroperoxidase family enzyme
MRSTPVQSGPADTLDELLARTPAAATLRAYADAVWADERQDAALLELCRLRLAQLLGLDPAGRTLHPAAVAAGLVADDVAELPRWHASPRFDARRRAALAFAEQWLLDPSGMTDDDCARLRAELGDAGCAAFTMGLALVEALLRVELVLGATSGPGEKET